MTFYKRDEPAAEEHHLRARTWPSFAMMVHGMIDETQRVMKDGGLMQPGVAERVQNLRSSIAFPAQ